MPAFIDQTGRQISLDKTPERIISLVPSQTELLFDLGSGEEVVGITKFCIHPEEWFCSKTKIGGTKQLKMDIIHQLRPDLVIANKEENVKEQVAELGNHYPVWISNVTNLDDAYEMIEQVGALTNKVKPAKDITDRIKENFAQLPAPDTKHRAAYLIWQKPFMTAGGDTFIHSMLGKAGFINVFGDKQRYPEITIEQIKKLHPEALLLSSEPFPFTQKHIDELAPLLPNTKIILADGEMFSWYGSRLLKACNYFKELMQSIWL